MEIALIIGCFGGDCVTIALMASQIMKQRCRRRGRKPPPDIVLMLALLVHRDERVRVNEMPDRIKELAARWGVVWEAPSGLTTQTVYRWIKKAEGRLGAGDAAFQEGLREVECRLAA